MIVAVEGCPAHRARRAYQQFIGRPCRSETTAGHHNGAENTPPTSTTNRRTAS